MKTKLIVLLTLLITTTTIAQQAINYRALIKDNLGNVIVNQAVTAQFAIIQGAGITTVCQEDHSATTAAIDMVILNISAGIILENGSI